MLLSYTGDPTYDLVLTIAFAYVAFVSVTAWFFPSPYGRFGTKKFGLALDPRLGWFLMELPATLSFVYFFSKGAHRSELVPRIFLVMWLMHYANRGFIFPMLMRVPRSAQATFSLMLVVIGWSVTSLHGYLHATYIADLGKQCLFFLC